MNRRLSTILLLAFVIAAVASFVVYRLAVNQARAATAASARVVVAARDLPVGIILHDTDLTTTEWIGTVPKGMMISKDVIVGRGVVAAMYQGEPILDSRLATPGSGAGLAAIIRPGMRACAVRVDEVVGVSGFVLPGMRVDVLISGTPTNSPADGPKVKTLLQNIEVLSAGTNIQKDNEGKPVQVQVVNLLVNPEQAELLSLTSNQTRIQLVLRNPLDTDTPKTPIIAMASVFSEGAVPPKARAVVYRKPAGPAAAPHIHTVEVFNGGKQTEEKFSSPAK